MCVVLCNCMDTRYISSYESFFILPEWNYVSHGSRVTRIALLEGAHSPIRPITIWFELLLIMDEVDLAQGTFWTLPWSSTRSPCVSPLLLRPDWPCCDDARFVPVVLKDSMKEFYLQRKIIIACWSKQDNCYLQLQPI